MTTIKKIFFNQKYLILSLALVLLVGIFVRAYHFGDWLRFNADQARDAIVVHDAATGNGELPLLGPKAGGTAFKLGPIFYYEQLLSVKIFGYSPEKYAYPDLFFSVLTILILFILSRRLFGDGIAISVAAVCSVSFFMVRYGRFAWNPNSTSFFVMLFLLAAYFILESRGKKIVWPVLLGVAVGIGIQLHTFLLLVLPTITILFFLFLFRERIFFWKNLLIVFLLVILLNTGQIVSEFKTGFANSKAFNSGVEVKTASSYSVGERIVMDLKCHATSNAYIVSSRGEKEECNQFFLENRLGSGKKSSQYPLWLRSAATLSIVMSIVFSIGGYLLFIWFAWKEKNRNKKVLMFLILAYALASFVAFVPIANELSMRYFLTGAFVPFVLLGAWMKFFLDRFKKISPLVFAVVLLLCISGLLVINKEFGNFGSGKVSDSDISVLGEIRPLADFMIANSAGSKNLNLIGESGFVRRFGKPLEYLVGYQGASLNQVREEEALENSDLQGVTFYIDKKSDKGDRLPIKAGHSVLKVKTSGKISLFLLGE